MEQQIGREQLMHLLPHKGKMFLLSRVDSYDIKTHSISFEYDITKDCIFYEQELGGIPNWVCFEIMAQGISAISSIERAENGTLDSSRPGVILSINNFSCEKDFFKEDTTVFIKITEDYHTEEVFRYECFLYESKADENPCAKAIISVMEMKDMSCFYGNN